MTVQEAIKKRRALRSLAPLDVTEDLINDLAESAGLAASCFNKQPWKFVFVYDKQKLAEMHQALSKGNEWAQKADLIIAVLGKKDDDCVIKDRTYYHFDTGMACAQLILRATELGLTAHPIAGYSPEKTREILNIPQDIEVITLLITGSKAEVIDQELSPQQQESEKQRPPRNEFKQFVYHNKYT